MDQEKTSLLESLHILGVGRSFRSHQIKNVIHHESNELTVFGKFAAPDNHTLGIARDKNNNYQIRINNTDQHKLSSLARYLPVLVITPDSYRLLTSGPQHRRQYLDLSVFHVEQQFSSNYKRYNRLLKQRNALLKQCQSYDDLKVWDKEYVLLAEAIHQARKQEFFHLKVHLEHIQGIFLPQYRVQYTYRSGWDSGSSQSLSEQLQRQFETDSRYGYSSIGAHKSDIKITIDNLPVQEVLSRGEQKVLVNSMYMAQAKRLSEDNNKHCLLLIDDLPSELDGDKQRTLLQELLTLQHVQLFITSITKPRLKELDLRNSDKTIKMFHVEQGKITLDNK